MPYIRGLRENFKCNIYTKILIYFNKYSVRKNLHFEFFYILRL